MAAGAASAAGAAAVVAAAAGAGSSALTSSAAAGAGAASVAVAASGAASSFFASSVAGLVASAAAAGSAVQVEHQYVLLYSKAGQVRVVILKRRPRGLTTRCSVSLGRLRGGSCSSGGGSSWCRLRGLGGVRLGLALVALLLEDGLELGLQVVERVGGCERESVVSKMTLSMAEGSEQDRMCATRTRQSSAELCHCLCLLTTGICCVTYELQAF